jgi:hypothetical protein
VNPSSFYDSKITNENVQQLMDEHEHLEIQGVSFLRTSLSMKENPRVSKNQLL